MKMAVKTRSYKSDINGPRRRHGQKYTRCNVSQLDYISM